MSLIDELTALLPDSAAPSIEDTWESLRQRITVLSERVWEGKNKWPEVEAWLQNFDGQTGKEPQIERLHALFLLSQFLYIGSAETRVLLKSIFLELFIIPLIQEIRSSLGGTRDVAIIRSAVADELKATRFLGVGNPSESGVHLLYYFRQENLLPKDLFLDSAQMFNTTVSADGSLSRIISDDSIRRYVFVDDVCGSGETVEKYSNNILKELVALKPNVKLYYLAMFSCAQGMDRVRRKTRFGSNSGAVFELDESYKCLSDRSRIMHAAPPNIDGDTLRCVATTYGHLLWARYPTGYDDNQMLLGFHHNTPDNTLPIIWWPGTEYRPWTPAFKRYPKL